MIVEAGATVLFTLTGIPSNYNCQDNEGHFGAAYPGYSDLDAVDVRFNDKISSFSCGPY